MHQKCHPIEMNMRTRRISYPSCFSHFSSRFVWLTSAGLAQLILLWTASALWGANAKASDSKDFKAAELFKVTNVWTVHLKFTPEQWEAMEPKGGGFFGGRGGPRGPGGFGPAMFVAPSFMKHGDQNQDGKLSKEEFQALAAKWFAQWDKEKRDKLNGEQLGAGLSATLEPPNFGRPA